MCVLASYACINHKKTEYTFSKKVFSSARLCTHGFYMHKKSRISRTALRVGDPEMKCLDLCGEKTPPEPFSVEKTFRRIETTFCHSTFDRIFS